MSRTRTFSYTWHHSPDDFAGLCHTVTTEKLIEVDGGIRVEGKCVGTQEDARVNQKWSKFHAGADFDAACTYRLQHGYTEVR